MGACFNQLMENESKESLAQMVCDGLDKMASLEAALREKEQERFAPLGDNHHNAAKCPYCNPQLAAMQSELAQAQAEIAEWQKEGARRSRIIDERTAERDLARAENDEYERNFSKRESHWIRENGRLQVDRDSLRSQLEAMRTVLDDLRNFYCNRECETMPDHDALCKKTSAFLAARAKQEAKV